MFSTLDSGIGSNIEKEKRGGGAGGQRWELDFGKNEDEKEREREEVRGKGGSEEGKLRNGHEEEEGTRYQSSEIQKMGHEEPGGGGVGFEMEEEAEKE